MCFSPLQHDRNGEGPRWNLPPLSADPRRLYYTISWSNEFTNGKVGRGIGETILIGEGGGVTRARRFTKRAGCDLLEAIIIKFGYGVQQ